LFLFVSFLLAFCRMVWRFFALGQLGEKRQVGVPESKVKSYMI